MGDQRSAERDWAKAPLIESTKRVWWRWCKTLVRRDAFASLRFVCRIDYSRCGSRTETPAASALVYFL